MRFSGTVGYADSQEIAPGVYKEVITERQYYGDVIRNTRRLESVSEGQTLNDDISVENSFSIMADPFAYENFMQMRYISWSGSKWTVTNVEVRRPRLILTVGGLWNGNTP